MFLYIKIIRVLPFHSISCWSVMYPFYSKSLRAVSHHIQFPAERLETSGNSSRMFKKGLRERPVQNVHKSSWIKKTKFAENSQRLKMTKIFQFKEFLVQHKYVGQNLMALSIFISLDSLKITGNKLLNIICKTSDSIWTSHSYIESSQRQFGICTYYDTFCYIIFIHC